MPKILFYSEMSSGKSSRGGQKKRFKDTLKSFLKSFEIKIDTWEKAARDRTSWRSLLRKGAKSCEAARQAASVLRRQKRKASAHESQTVATISCPHCPRLFKAMHRTDKSPTCPLTDITFCLLDEELVPWNDEKKFVPEIIETKRARKKKVLSDMISLDENPLALTRTLQRLSKLPCTPKQLVQSSVKRISALEYKNMSFENSTRDPYANAHIFPKPSKGSITKSSSTIKYPQAANSKMNRHVIERHSEIPTYRNRNEGKNLLRKDYSCYLLDTSAVIPGKVTNSNVSSERISMAKKQKGQKKISLLGKSSIKLGKHKHILSSDGEIVFEDETSVRPIVITENEDGSTTVEDHDETYILTNVELRSECDDECPCKIHVKPCSSTKENQGVFVIHFILLPEHKSLSPDNKIVYRCDVCDSAYNHAISLKRHYLSVHVNHRYLSREDIVSCQIETFHTGIELERKQSLLEMQTFLMQSKKPSLGEQQLSISPTNVLPCDKISTKTSTGLSDNLLDKDKIDNTYLILEKILTCEKVTVDLKSKVIKKVDNFTVPSLRNLAQMSIDGGKVIEVSSSDQIFVACDPINQHSSVVNNGVSLEYDKSLDSDLLCPLESDMDCDYATNDKETLNSVNSCLMNIDDSRELNINHTTSSDTQQDVQRQCSEIAKLNDEVSCQDMSFSSNGLEIKDRDSFAEVIQNQLMPVGSVNIIDSYEAAQVSVDTNCFAETSQSVFSYADTSEMNCSDDNVPTTVNNVGTFHSNVECNTGTSTLFKMFSYKVSPKSICISSSSNDNPPAEEAIEPQVKFIDKVCTSEALQRGFEKDIVSVAQKNNGCCSLLNDPDILHCSSVRTINNDDIPATIVNCATISLTPDTVDLHTVSVENELDDSVIKAKANIDKECTKSPAMDNHILQEKAGNEVQYTESSLNRLVTESNLNEMVTANNLNEMVTESSLNEMVTENNLNEMVTENNLNEMVTENNLNEMVTENNLNEMVTENNLNEMVTESSLNEMVTENNLNEMVTESSLNEMVTENNMNEMVTENNLNEMVTESSLNKMVTENNLNEMVTENNLNEMVTENNLNEMVTESSLSEMFTASNLNEMVTESNLYEIDTKMNGELTSSEMTAVSSKTDNIPGTIVSTSVKLSKESAHIFSDGLTVMDSCVDCCDPLLPAISQTSCSTNDTETSNNTEDVLANTSKVHENIEKSNILLPKKSTVHNTKTLLISKLDCSTSSCNVSTSSAVIQKQPPQQLIFVTNIVFPVMSSSHKQIHNSTSLHPPTVSQGSLPITNQTAMTGHTAGIPLVVISQVPCGRSVQNAAKAFLQSPTALQNIKNPFNVLSLGNTASGLSSSVLPSVNKSSSATTVSGNSSLIISTTLSGLPSTTLASAVTSTSPSYCSPSTSRHTSIPLKPAAIITKSSPLTTVSLLNGPHLPRTGSTKSILVSKTIASHIPNFISPNKNVIQLVDQPDDLYRCHMCVLVFKTLSELKQHIRNDPHRFKGLIKQYACLQCSMRFSNKINLMRHNLINHLENESYKFRCFTCGKGFMSETYLKMHARFHSGKNFPCKYGCVDIYFPNAASLVKHLRTQHAGLDLKEYLRNAKENKVHRKKLNCIFGVSDEQITRLEIPGKTLKANKTVVTSSSVIYSLDQPGVGFQAKRSGSKCAKNTSKDDFQIVEDKNIKIDKQELLMNEEQKHKLRFVCNLCMKGFSSHLQRLQHKTQRHGANQSVQEYLYQMSKETIDEEISETEWCKQQEFSPPSSPKTFFENVNRRGFENMAHYIDGSRESVKLWQKHSNLTVGICEPALTSKFKKKIEWTVFNFPPCFQYKEDCTVFYDSIIKSDATNKVSCDIIKAKQQEEPWNVCNVSDIKQEFESNNVFDTLDKNQTANKLLEIYKSNLHFRNGIEFSNENSSSVDSQECSSGIVSKLENCFNENRENVNYLEKGSDILLEVENKKENLSEESVDREIDSLCGDLVSNLQGEFESNSLLSAYSGVEDCSLHKMSRIRDCANTSNTRKKDIHSPCMCIVNDIVNNAVKRASETDEMKYNPSEPSPLVHENHSVTTCQNEEISGNPLLDLDTVSNINDIKVDGLKQETSTMIVEVTPVSCETYSDMKLNQDKFTDLSMNEIYQQAIGSQYIHGLNLDMPGQLTQHCCLNSFSNSDIKLNDKISNMSHSSLFLIDALNLHIMGKQLSSKMIHEMMCTDLKNASTLSPRDKSLSFQSLVMPQTKQSHGDFYHARDTCLNNLDTSRHDHRRYSIWAGQVHQNFDSSNKKETFCQPVTDAMRKQEAMQQQAKCMSEKSARDQEIFQKHHIATEKISFAEKLGLMTRNEFELSYHAQRQQEFVIKAPEVWENYENIWFGKKGNITVVCSICHRHFSCWDLCLRHQLKKHPHIEPASLEMEKDNYVEDMYYYYPMPYGILAQTHLTPDNMPTPEVFVCTRCGFPFKNINRLHAHMIVCDPAQEEATASQNDNLKKPSYMKKKLLPMMNRRLYQTFQQPKSKVSQPFKGFVYQNAASLDVKNRKSPLAHGEINKLSLRTFDEKPPTSSLQSRSSHFVPFSFYSGRKHKGYELLYNPQNHTRRREMYKVLDQHQCHGCNLKFNSLYMLEKHVNKCSGRDKLQSQKPLLSGIMPDDAAVRKQHTCRYCSKRFTYIKGVDLHYKRICAVRKVKEEENQLTEEDLAHEAELQKILEHIKWSKSLNQDSSDIIQGLVRVEEDGTLTRVVKKQDWPQSLQKKIKKKGGKWTTLKRHHPDDMTFTSSSSSIESSPVVPVDKHKLLAGEKVCEKLTEVLGAAEKRTSSASHEEVHEQRTTKRQTSTDRDLVKKMGKAVSQSSLTDMCSKKVRITLVPIQNTINGLCHGKKDQIKTSGFKVDTSMSKQKKTNATSSVKNSKLNMNGSYLNSTSSPKVSSKTATTALPVSFTTEAGIKLPARKRGKPKRFDPSDMESSYKKKKKFDDGYIYHQRTTSTKNELHERKGNRYDSSLASTSHKNKTDSATKGSNYVCESYMLRNKSHRHAIDSSSATLHKVSNTCSSSSKEESNIESSKLLAKMKRLKEDAKSERNKSSQRRKSPSAFDVVKPSSADSGSSNYYSKKDDVEGKKLSRPSNKTTSSSELLKQLTKDGEILMKKNLSQKSTSKRKKTVPPSSPQVDSVEDRWAPVKRLKITKMGSNKKTSTKTHGSIIKKTPVTSGLKTLNKSALKLDEDESSDCSMESDLAPSPEISTGLIKTNKSSTLTNKSTSNSPGSKGIFSKSASPISKQPIASVRVVTLSPNGTNLLTYDSSDDKQQSPILLTKSTDVTRVSVPIKINPNLSQGPAQHFTKPLVHLQPKDLQKTVLEQGNKIASTDKHEVTHAESSKFVRTVNSQAVKRLTISKTNTGITKSIVEGCNQSHASQKCLTYQLPVTDKFEKQGLASVIVYEDKDINQALANTEKQITDNKNEHGVTIQDTLKNDTQEKYAVTMQLLSSTEDSPVLFVDQIDSKLSVKHASKHSLDSEITLPSNTSQVIKKVIGKPFTTEHTTSARQNQIVVCSVPQTLAATLPYSHWQTEDAVTSKNQQNTIQQVSKLVHSVNSSELKSSYITTLQSACLPTLQAANSLSEPSSNEIISASIVPMTTVRTQVAASKSLLASPNTRVTFPTRFGSPTKLVTLTGTVIPHLVQGNTVQSTNKILKLGSLGSKSSFITSPKPQTSIIAQCKQFHTAPQVIVTHQSLPLNVGQFPKLLATGIHLERPSTQQKVRPVTHSLLNIATNQTHLANQLVKKKRPAKTFSQQMCMPQSNINNNPITISPSSVVTNIGNSCLKTNRTPNTSFVAVSSTTPVTNQIMFSLEDGTTAMLDPDSLAQLLSTSPSLNKSELCSLTSVRSVSLDVKSTVASNIVKAQPNAQSEDEINWPTNGTIDLTTLPDIVKFE